MRLRRLVLAGILSALTITTITTMAAQAQPAPTFESTVTNTWKSLHNKILAMAKDTLYPDDKLSLKPHPDSRTVLDEFRHVTIGLEMSTSQLTGQAFDYNARLKADEAKPKTRASVVAEMEAALAASYAAVEKNPKPSLIFWIDHQAEHYGKLVSNYRMAGVVPPVSRK
ncbi:MAG TPA: hypothetical protein VMZ90_01770 [Vicinamibacterales bacterium]|nr:hypothetical protein [Vicinamibacterales bacterium]